MASLGQFIGRRREGWARLEALLQRTEGNGLRGLSAADLNALAAEYRHLTSDLAVAQRDFPHDQLTAHLNALAARAHLRLYRAPGASWRQVARFFTVDFARRLGESSRYLAAAAALFLAPAVWAYVGSLLDPTIRAALVPRQLIAIMERGSTWTDIPPEMRPAMAALVFTNNIRVAFVAFAGGVSFGLLTVYAMVANGLMVGGILGAAQHYQVAHLLWGFVSPHGYLEITSVIIAGAAGLRLGHALLRPGLLRRRDALTRASRHALALVLGAAPVFVLAGLVEGLVSPSGLPYQVKLAIGPLLWLAFIVALAVLGRNGSRRLGGGTSPGSPRLATLSGAERGT